MEWLATKLGFPDILWLISNIIVMTAMWLFVFAWRSARADCDKWRSKAEEYYDEALEQGVELMRLYEERNHSRLKTEKLIAALNGCAGLLEDVKNMHPNYTWVQKGIDAAEEAMEEEI